MTVNNLEQAHYDYLIVGAGIFGATVARTLADRGRSVFVVEKRDHIGGNVYSEDIEGICVHKYGPHIFHTDSEEVWTFVNRFARFNNYFHRPVANWHGELYSLPFNMNTFREMWGVTEPEEARLIIEEQAAAYRNSNHVYADRGEHVRKAAPPELDENQESSASIEADTMMNDTHPETEDFDTVIKDTVPDTEYREDSDADLPGGAGGEGTLTTVVPIEASCNVTGETPAVTAEIIEHPGNELIEAGDRGGNCTNSLESHAISMVGTDIYEKLIQGYTEKQWGRPCSKLPASIIRRIPIRYEYNNDYFDDRYQGIPVDGYTDMIRRMLDGIEVMTGVDFLDPAHRGDLEARADRIIYTGQIDAYYDYCYGPLEYRGLRFDTEILELCNDPIPTIMVEAPGVGRNPASIIETEIQHWSSGAGAKNGGMHIRLAAPGRQHSHHYQSAAVVNYTDKETPWTRIVEHSYFSETVRDGNDQEPLSTDEDQPAEWITGITEQEEASSKEACIIQKKFDDSECDVYSGSIRNRSEYPSRDMTRGIAVITREYPAKWRPGDEAFYPVNDAANQELYERYLSLAGADSKVVFGGRLGSYRYYDMDDAVAAALSLASQL